MQFFKHCHNTANQAQTPTRADGTQYVSILGKYSAEGKYSRISSDAKLDSNKHCYQKLLHFQLSNIQQKTSKCTEDIQLR